MNGQSGECLATVVTIPHHNFVGPSGQKAVHRSVDFAGQQLAEFIVLGVCLVLPANAANSFGIGDQEDSFLLGERSSCGGDKGEANKEQKTHV